jgi:tellurite resistance protein TehA-like permease
LDSSKRRSRHVFPWIRPAGEPPAPKSGRDALRSCLSVRFGSLFPGYFALVMATGIVSITARNLGHHGIGWALFSCNILAYLLFWSAGLFRLVTNGSGMLREITHHETGAGFLTIVAGTSVLGSEFATFQLAAWVVPVLFAAAVLFWWGFLYAFLAGVTERPRKPSLETGFSGQWLLVVVATESLAVLGADILRQFGGPPALAFACYAWVLLGAVFYLVLEAVVLYRFAFVPMSPDEVTGPWWINEGAAAITVLAGTKLMAVSGLHVGQFAMRDLLAPLMVALWAEATFWIPLLLLLFAWKHMVRHRLLRYAPGQWSVVFPLGMYAAATLQLGQAYDLPFLHFVPAGFFWIAFLAWVMAFVGAMHGVARGLTA